MALAAAAAALVAEVEEEAAVVVVGAEEEAVVGAVVVDVKSCHPDNGFTGFCHDDHACVCSFLRPKVTYATDF